MTYVQGAMLTQTHELDSSIQRRSSAESQLPSCLYIAPVFALSIAVTVGQCRAGGSPADAQHDCVGSGCDGGCGGGSDSGGAGWQRARHQPGSDTQRSLRHMMQAAQEMRNKTMWMTWPARAQTRLVALSMFPYHQPGLVPDELGPHVLLLTHGSVGAEITLRAGSLRTSTRTDVGA
jgi:hypothetical protein